MKQAYVLAACLLVAGCGDAPPTDAGKAVDADTPEVVQQKELAEQKLTIEQAAEEATKLIEADAKAEIDAASSGGNASQ